jgi:magnesium chelatase subunit H
VRDLRTWLTTYAYWNQGGLDNVVSLFLYLARECFALEAAEAKVRASHGLPGTCVRSAQLCTLD